jgi:hypothetical protein
VRREGRAAAGFFVERLRAQRPAESFKFGLFGHLS